MQTQCQEKRAIKWFDKKCKWKKCIIVVDCIDLFSLRVSNEVTTMGQTFHMILNRNESNKLRVHICD